MEGFLLLELGIFIVCFEFMSNRKFLVCVAFVAILTSCKSVKDRPYLDQFNASVPERVKVTDNFYILGTNKLLKNQQDLWELYITGDPLERGLANGKLTKELMYIQEKALLDKVNAVVPSKMYQSVLKFFIFLFNRNLYRHIDNEFKAEIYGVSRSASDEFDKVGDKYVRILYYHAAHDIGHVLQDLAMVGCTSFAVWGDKTEDGKLLIGRNFDFYAGDDFSREKIIAFTAPRQGHKFVSVTWGGMIGVVSGMNDKGLTVTINAGKSDIPTRATTPVSILAREILQYASTIEEAVEIAKKKQVFVSESLLIGSAFDKKAVTIEVAPENFGVFEVDNSNVLICTNHFQSENFKNDVKNQKHIEESHSQYRFQRVAQLLEKNNQLNPSKIVSILRNKKGIDDKDIGYGNEKALNQLLAHHGIVFKPEELKIWVSSNPYQLGEFVAYDLNTAFDNFEKMQTKQSVADTDLNILADPFLKSTAYTHYEKYRVKKRELKTLIYQNKRINREVLKEFERLNPDFWETYYILGNYYFSQGYYTKAKETYLLAKEKEVTTVPDMEKIDKQIKKCFRKIN